MQRITLKDGTTHLVEIDGGGVAAVGENAGRPEIHGTYADGSFFCAFEDRVDDVVEVPAARPGLKLISTGGGRMIGAYVPDYAKLVRVTAMVNGAQLAVAMRPDEADRLAAQLTASAAWLRHNEESEDA